MRACVRGCDEYNIMNINVHIIVDIVKRGVLTLVSEIRRYRNERYFILLICLN